MKITFETSEVGVLKVIIEKTAGNDFTFIELTTMCFALDREKQNIIQRMIECDAEEKLSKETSASKTPTDTPETQGIIKETYENKKTTGS